MGDRANVVFPPRKEALEAKEQSNLYLYTHWCGEELPHMVQKVLKKELRWNDPAYLARMIFCEMLTQAASDETGFGISTSLPDNEHLLVFVDCETEEVSFRSEGSGIIQSKWSFKRYCELTEAQIKKAYDK